MKKLLNITLLALVLMVTSCNHKDLCYNHREHAHKFHVKIAADYRYDWEENHGYKDWLAFWPEGYINYESLRPGTPKGLRVINYNEKMGIGFDERGIHQGFYRFITRPDTPGPCSRCDSRADFGSSRFIIIYPCPRTGYHQCKRRASLRYRRCDRSGQRCFRSIFRSW